MSHKRQPVLGYFVCGWNERDRTLTQSDRGVPSSANWNPTKPLIRRQQYVAATRPVYTAVNHYTHTRVSAAALMSAEMSGAGAPDIRHLLLG